MVQSLKALQQYFLYFMKYTRLLYFQELCEMIVKNLVSVY